jgi:enamine deaminase RidA (YjgF/YER057c/UK114 family)
MKYGTIPIHDDGNTAPAWCQQKKNDSSIDRNNEQSENMIVSSRLSILRVVALAFLAGVAATVLLMNCDYSIFPSRLATMSTVPYVAETAADFLGRQVVSSGTIFEEMYGYSRAVRSGNIIQVSGTIAIGSNGKIVGRGNATVQAEFVLQKIQSAIQDLGGRIDDVVRTRIYVSSRDYALDVAQVHGQVFQNVRPANTLVVAQLIEEEYLVEIEAEAFVGSTKRQGSST